MTLRRKNKETPIVSNVDKRIKTIKKPRKGSSATEILKKMYAEIESLNKKDIKLD